jgi:hypothetical protein
MFKHNKAVVDYVEGDVAFAKWNEAKVIVQFDMVSLRVCLFQEHMVVVGDDVNGCHLQMISS